LRHRAPFGGSHRFPPRASKACCGEGAYNLDGRARPCSRPSRQDIENGSHFLGLGRGVRLVVEGLDLSRGERRLTRDLSFVLAPGEAVSLTGANGAGKTSLLRAVAGFLMPDAGRIAFDRDGAEVEPDEARARGVHLMGHLDGLKTGRRARDELAFAAGWLGAAPDAVARAVEVLHLEPLLGLEVRKLSAGQRRRLAFTRLIAAPRPIWLLDEPLAPLDAQWRHALGAVFAEHLGGGGSILAAVHDPLPVPSRELSLGRSQ
jgi:heme exporter protein A